MSERASQKNKKKEIKTIDREKENNNKKKAATKGTANNMRNTLPCLCQNRDRWAMAKLNEKKWHKIHQIKHSHTHTPKETRLTRTQF